MPMLTVYTSGDGLVHVKWVGMVDEPANPYWLLFCGKGCQCIRQI